MAETVQAFRPGGIATRVTVLDNGSDPEALEEIRRLVDRLPDVDLVALGRNAGFGPAANVGLRRWLRREEGDLVLVAPHDARPQGDCLERVATAMRAHPEVGLASADVGDGRTPVIDPYFGSISTQARRSSGLEDADYPHGTLLVARRSCLRDVGLFDERYFAYCEEADLGLRARRRGWRVAIVRDAAVRNPAMGPGPGPDVVDYLMQRNTLLLVRSHFGRYRASVRLCIALLQLARGALDSGWRPLLYAPRGRAAGIADYLRGRFGAPPLSLFAHPPNLPSSAAATTGRTRRR